MDGHGDGDEHSPEARARIVSHNSWAQDGVTPVKKPVVNTSSVKSDAKNVTKAAIYKHNEDIAEGSGKKTSPSHIAKDVNVDVDDESHPVRKDLASVFQPSEISLRTVSADQVVRKVTGPPSNRLKYEAQVQPCSALSSSQTTPVVRKATVMPIGDLSIKKGKGKEPEDQNRSVSGPATVGELAHKESKSNLKTRLRGFFGVNDKLSGKPDAAELAKDREKVNNFLEGKPIIEEEPLRIKKVGPAETNNPMPEDVSAAEATARKADSFPVTVKEQIGRSQLAEEGKLSALESLNRTSGTRPEGIIHGSGNLSPTKDGKFGSSGTARIEQGLPRTTSHHAIMVNVEDENDTLYSPGTTRSPTPRNTRFQPSVEDDSNASNASQTALPAHCQSLEQRPVGSIHNLQPPLAASVAYSPSVYEDGAWEHHPRVGSTLPPFDIRRPQAPDASTRMYNSFAYNGYPADTSRHHSVSSYENTSVHSQLSHGNSAHSQQSRGNTLFAGGPSRVPYNAWNQELHEGAASGQSSQPFEPYFIYPESAEGNEQVFESPDRRSAFSEGTNYAPVPMGTSGFQLLEPLPPNLDNLARSIVHHVDTWGRQLNYAIANSRDKTNDNVHNAYAMVQERLDDAVARLCGDIEGMAMNFSDHLKSLADVTKKVDDSRVAENIEMQHSLQAISNRLDYVESMLGGLGRDMMAQTGPVMRIEGMLQQMSARHTREMMAQQLGARPMPVSLPAHPGTRRELRPGRVVGSTNNVAQAGHAAPTPTGPSAQQSRNRIFRATSSGSVRNMASGRPVVAQARAGPVSTIQPGFDRPSEDRRDEVTAPWTWRHDRAGRANPGPARRPQTPSPALAAAARAQRVTTSASEGGAASAPRQPVAAVEIADGVFYQAPSFINDRAEGSSEHTD